MRPTFLREAGAMLTCCAALTGGLLAILMAAFSTVLAPRKALKAYGQAIPTLWMAAFILMMA